MSNTMILHEYASTVIMDARFDKEQYVLAGA